MRALINQELVKRLPKGPEDIRDTKLTGFVLRVRAPGGTHTYFAQWTVPGAPGESRKGRTRWKAVGTTATHEPHEARAEARKVLGQTYNGKDPIAEAKAQRKTEQAGITFREFVATEFPTLTTARTATAEAARLTALFVPVFGDRRLDSLTADDVLAWRRDRLKAGKARATIDRDVNTLRAALRLAMTTKAPWKLAADPLVTVKKLDPSDIATASTRYLSDDEEQRLRAALAARDDARRAQRDRANAWRRQRAYALWPAYRVYTDHLTPIVLLALNTGCRRAELFTLRWRDVNLTTKVLTVQGSNAKSGKTRHIPLNTEAVQVLTTWRPATATPSDPVFPGDHGDPLTDIKGSWLPIVKAATITGFRFHDLRHTFASKLVMAGVDLNTVRELLGHSNPKMTIRYSHISPTHKAAAVERLVRS